MSGAIKNITQLGEGIELVMKKYEAASVVIFRELIWEIFCEILQQTPQWSGKAVANWNIGVGGPDQSIDDSYGDWIDLRDDAHKKGDDRWILAAMVRNYPRLQQIKRREKVYITNYVMGDDDRGQAGTQFYMEALQDPGYWQRKLRADNRPYEIVVETVNRVGLEFKADGKRAGGGFAISMLGGRGAGF